MENYVESLYCGWNWKKEQPMDKGDGPQDKDKEEIKYCVIEH